MVRGWHLRGVMRVRGWELRCVEVCDGEGRELRVWRGEGGGVEGCGERWEGRS